MMVSKVKNVKGTSNTSLGDLIVLFKFFIELLTYECQFLINFIIIQSEHVTNIVFVLNNLARAQPICVKS